MLRKGQKITELKTGKTGVYLRKNPRNLSINLVYVRWHSDNHESQICTSLLKECQFNGNPVIRNLNTSLTLTK